MDVVRVDVVRADVVRADGAGEADVFVGADAFGHIGVAVIVKGFLEGWDDAFDIAEMGEVDLVGEAADAFGDIDSHRGEVALTVGDAVVVAGYEVYDTLEGVDVGDDTRDSADG